MKDRKAWTDGQTAGKSFVRSLVPADIWTPESIREFCDKAQEAYEQNRGKADEYDQYFGVGVRYEANEILFPLMHVLGADGRSVARPIGDGYTWGGKHRVRRINNSPEPTAEEIRESAELDSHMRISIDHAQRLADANLARRPEHRQTALQIGRGVFMQAEMDVFDSMMEKDPDPACDGVIDGYY